MVTLNEGHSVESCVFFVIDAHPGAPYYLGEATFLPHCAQTGQFGRYFGVIELQNRQSRKAGFLSKDRR